MASSPEIGRQNPHQQAKWLAMILKPSLNKTMLERLYHNRFFFFEYQWSMYMDVIWDPQSWDMSLWWMCPCSALLWPWSMVITSVSWMMEHFVGEYLLQRLPRQPAHVLHAQCFLVLKLKFYIHILPLYVVPFDASLLNAKNLRS